MMLTIPETYFKNNEDYITIAAIHKFMRNYPAGTFKLTSPREELLNSIISFGNENENNTEIVLDWIDGVLHEGIKDIYLQYAPMPEEVSVLLLDEQGINRYLNAHTSCMENKHLCMNQYSADYTLVSAVYIEEEHGRAIRFTYCKKLHVHDQKNLTTKLLYLSLAFYFCQFNIFNALFIVSAASRCATVVTWA